MNVWTALVIIVPSLVSGLYIWLAYKREKRLEAKDEIWETATRIICAHGNQPDGDDFAWLYMELKLFKEQGYTIGDPTLAAQLTSQRNKQG